MTHAAPPAPPPPTRPLQQAPVFDRGLLGSALTWAATSDLARDPAEEAGGPVGGYRWRQGIWAALPAPDGTRACCLGGWIAAAVAGLPELRPLDVADEAAHRLLGYVPTHSEWGQRDGPAWLLGRLLSGGNDLDDCLRAASALAGLFGQPPLLLGPDMTVR